MSDIFYIDRIEDGTATAEREDGTREQIPADRLPEGVREGAVLRLTDGAYVRDEAAEQERKQRMLEKQRRLFHKDSN